MVKKRVLGNPSGSTDPLLMMEYILSAGEACKKHGCSCDHSDVENCVYNVLKNSQKKKEKQRHSNNNCKESMMEELHLITLSPPRPQLQEEEEEENFKSWLSARVSEAVGEVAEAFTLVIRKKLTKTDLSTNNNRMSIPMTQMLNDNFLTEEEDAELNNKKNIKLGYFLDPNMGMVDEVTLVMWSMEKGSVYNINGGWKTVLDRNRKNLLNLAAGDEIELWSFRSVSGALCFVLVSNDTKRRMADADADQEDQVMMLEYGVEAGSSSQTQEHNDLTLEL